MMGQRHTANPIPWNPRLQPCKVSSSPESPYPPAPGPRPGMPLDLSIQVSWATHFRVLDKSPLLGPGRGSAPCNSKHLSQVCCCCDDSDGICPIWPRDPFSPRSPSLSLPFLEESSGRWWWDLGDLGSEPRWQPGLLHGAPSPAKWGFLSGLPPGVVVRTRENVEGLWGLEKSMQGWGLCTISHETALQAHIVAEVSRLVKPTLCLLHPGLWILRTLLHTHASTVGHSPLSAPISGTKAPFPSVFSLLPIHHSPEVSSVTLLGGWESDPHPPKGLSSTGISFLASPLPR